MHCTKKEFGFHLLLCVCIPSLLDASSIHCHNWNSLTVIILWAYRHSREERGFLLSSVVGILHTVSLSQVYFTVFPTSAAKIFYSETLIQTIYLNYHEPHMKIVIGHSVITDSCSDKTRHSQTASLASYILHNKSVHLLLKIKYTAACVSCWNLH
jgi:hypothetical protein